MAIILSCITLMACRGLIMTLELDDPAVVVAGDEVDTVHVLAVHLRLELERRGIAGEGLVHIPERPRQSVVVGCIDVGIGIGIGIGCIIEDRIGRVQIHHRERLAPLRGEHDRREEHHVVVQQLLETPREVAPQMVVPVVDGLLDHPARLSIRTHRPRTRRSLGSPRPTCAERSCSASDPGRC